MFEQQDGPIQVVEPVFESQIVLKEGQTWAACPTVPAQDTKDLVGNGTLPDIHIDDGQPDNPARSNETNGAATVRLQLSERETRSFDDSPEGWAKNLVILHNEAETLQKSGQAQDSARRYQVFLDQISKLVASRGPEYVMNIARIADETYSGLRIYNQQPHRSNYGAIIRAQVRATIFDAGREEES